MGVGNRYSEHVPQDRVSGTVHLRHGLRHPGRYSLLEIRNTGLGETRSARNSLPVRTVCPVSRILRSILLPMRAFIAIDLPESLHATLAEMQQAVRGAAQGARWTRPEGIHLTLKFLG